MRSNLTITALGALALLPLGMLAAEPTFQPLVGIPNVDPNAGTSSYINALYTLSITAASMLVVVKIIYAGVQYMFSEIVTSKEKAKKDIFGALLGLLIILGAVTILNTINPNLLQLDIIDNIEEIDLVSERFVPDTRTHDDLRDEIRETHTVVGDTFTGQLGSREHTAFVISCRESGGRVVSAGSSGVECRHQ